MRMLIDENWIDKPEKIEVCNPYDNFLLDTVLRVDTANIKHCNPGQEGIKFALQEMTEPKLVCFNL